MIKGYRVLPSAYKHGITESEIDYVLSDMNPTRRCYEMHDDTEGNPQDMYIAHTGTRPWAIEVALSYRLDENVVFHASRLTKEFEKLFEDEP